MKKYIVYMHVNKTNGKKYIGVTGNSTHVRWREGKGYIDCRLFYRAINKYGWDGFEHLILKENLSVIEAQKTEIELIKKYKTTDRKFGYNLESGGNLKNSNNETRKLISDSVKKSWLKRTKEERTLSASGEKNNFYNRKHTEETKNKMREKKIGSTLSEEHKKKISNTLKKEVIQLSLEGEFINSFDSAKDASLKLGFSKSCITRVCQKIRKTHRGYKWMYREEFKKSEAG